MGDHTTNYFRNSVERLTENVTDAIIHACGGKERDVERRPITEGEAMQTRIFEHGTNSTSLERWRVRVTIEVERLP